MLALSLADVSVTYRGADGEAVTAVDIAALAVAPGRLTAIAGPSGSGKSTLLYLVSGIERPSRGAVRWGGMALFDLGEARRDAWRRRHVGFVFQDFHLIDELSPVENVLLPSYFERWSPGPLRRQAVILLERFGVPPSRNLVRQLSRGERQRVALARALLFAPPVILADEPTASLDEANARAVVDELLRLAREGHTVIAASHDPLLLSRAEVLRIEHGRLAS